MRGADQQDIDHIDQLPPEQDRAAIAADLLGDVPVRAPQLTANHRLARDLIDPHRLEMDPGVLEQGMGRRRIAQAQRQLRSFAAQ